MAAPFNLLDLYFGAVPPKVICDIGAADGEDTVAYARWYPQARVEAFEPVPQNLEVLRKRVRAAALEDRIRVYDFALGIVDVEDAPFWVSDSDETRVGHHWLSSSLRKPAMHEVYHPWCRFTPAMVNVRRLERVLGPGVEVDFVHLDVQGAELDVLLGAGSLCARFRAIWMEVSNVEMYADQPLRSDVAEFMEAAGLRLYMDLLGAAPQGDQLWVR